MQSLVKQSRRKLCFLRGATLGGFFGQVATALGGGEMRDASLESCLKYLEYLENVDINGEEPIKDINGEEPVDINVEGPSMGGQRQTMLFEELN